MNDNSTYYIDLITRYFSGEIAEEELRSLSAWLKADIQNQDIFRQYQETWHLIEKQRSNTLIDINHEWEALQSKKEASSAVPDNRVKIIPLHGNNNIKTTFQKIWKVAATVTILLVSSFLLYLYLSKPGNIILTAQNTNLEQVLPDGSVVTLHAGSQIIYPEKFSSSSRHVELKGEAYFKVAHDKTKPFFVASGDARIEVLGTQFNVNTHNLSGNLEVVLTSGKVSVYYKGKPGDNVLLNPGEKAELFSDKQQILKTANADPNYISWKTHMLVFDNESLSQVVNTLQNVYQARIQIVDTQLSGCRVTASFNKQSLQSVLQVLKETLELEVKQNGNTITITGKSCR